jgi:hypothetical protein
MEVKVVTRGMVGLDNLNDVCFLSISMSMLRKIKTGT